MTRCFTRSQWSCPRTGVICSARLVLVTRRAAQFWTLWSRLSWAYVTPDRRALPMSSLGVTKACTSCSVVVCERKGRMGLMFRRWRWAAEHTRLIWAAMVTLKSCIMPKFLTLLDGMMEASPTGMLSTETFFSRWDEPKKMTSALSSFNFKKFVSIQCCTSAMQCTIRPAIWSKVTWDGSNEK